MEYVRTQTFEIFVLSHNFSVLNKFTISIFWVLRIVWISASNEICKKHMTLECSNFSYFCCTIENHFPHVLVTILLTWRLMKIFYFLSHFHRNVYWKLFTKLVNLFASWARPNINILDPLVIEVWKYRQHRRVGSFFTTVLQLQYSYENYNWNLFKNRSKWVSAEACQDIFHSF